MIAKHLTIVDFGVLFCCHSCVASLLLLLCGVRVAYSFVACLSHSTIDHARTLFEAELCSCWGVGIKHPLLPATVGDVGDSIIPTELEQHIIRYFAPNTGIGVDFGT